MARLPAVLEPHHDPFRLSGRNAHSVSLRGLAGQWIGRLIALAAAAVIAYALLALVYYSVSGLSQLSAGTLSAVANSIALAVVASFGGVVLGAALAGGSLFGGPIVGRLSGFALRYGWVIPAIAFATGWIVLFGRPGDPGQAVIAVLMVQSLAGGFFVAGRLLRAAMSVDATLDDVARDLGAGAIVRFRTLHWPVWKRAAIGSVPILLGLSIADLASPVLLAPELPSAPVLVWNSVLAGNWSLAAVGAAVIGILAFLSIRLGERFASGAEAVVPSRSVLPVIPKTASLMVSIAGFAVVALSVALLAMVAVGTVGLSDLRPVTITLAPAIAGSLVGGLLAAIAVFSAREWPGLAGPFEALSRQSPIAIGLGLILGFGGVIFDSPTGTVLGMVLFGALFGLSTTWQVLDETFFPEPPVVEAALDLGEPPTTLRRRLTGPSLRQAVPLAGADTVISGGFALVGAIGLAHPLNSALVAGGEGDVATVAALVLALIVCRAVFIWSSRFLGQREALP